jgi:hypothetical protein
MTHAFRRAERSLGLPARSFVRTNGNSATLLGMLFLSVTGVTGIAAAGAGCSCDGDLNANGSVDAADLAILLGAWNTRGAESDLDGSGAVDAADLGILLGQWGACSGPANDTCQTAAILPSSWDQALPFCTVNAGTDGPANAACEVAGSNQIFSDIWYKVASPTAGMLAVSTCGANFDTRLAVYEPGLFGATCPNDGLFTAFLLGCNDDSNACGVASLNSSLLVPVEAGDTYAIRVGGYNLDEGNGTLDVTFFERGDLIEDAIPVNLVDNGDGAIVILSGTTQHMTPSPNPNPNSCGGVNDSKDVWFKISVDCANGGAQPVNLSASTCLDGTNFDTTLTIYKGSAASPVEVDCNDDQTWSNCLLNGVGRKSYVSIDPDTTETYWVRLAGFNGATGAYEVKFEFHCLN